MRYVINDDDLEDWYKILYQLNQETPNHALEYVLDEMEREIRTLVPEKNIESFLNLLRNNK